MGKLLIILLAFGLLLWLARSRNPPPPPPRPRIPPPEGMVACAHCGVNLPRSEALMLQDRPYCTARHRDAGPRQTS